MTEYRYSAFISYRSGSRRQTVRLKKDLFAIAKRHPGHTEFRVFLDESDLRPGPLSEEILAALRQSRCLVVALDQTTVGSVWVADEISYWLDHGGAPDRLFLVRLDEELDLSWQGTGFRAADKLPAPLREAFTTEQKWVEYSGGWWRGRAALVGLCAKLMDIEASEYLLEEAGFQRRRTRRIIAVAVVMALLTAAAGVLAYVANENRKTADHNAQQARAQADAAEALLAAQDAPTLAIERALRASKQSDSPTVRSAMLAVSHAARRLKRALVFPENETGHPITAARFSADSKKLIAWGPGAKPGTSLVLVWRLDTGEVDAKVVVEAEDLREVVTAGNRRLAACTAGGPIVIDIAKNTTTKLSGPNCTIHQGADSLVLLGAAAHVVDQRGRATSVDGITSVAANPSAGPVLLAGAAGLIVFSGGQQTKVAADPGATAVFADFEGSFLVKWSLHDWGVLPRGGELRRHQVPAIATDVAPLLHNDRLTGDLGWIADDGTIGWTRDERRLKMENAKGESVWKPYRPRLEPLSSANFVAVYRNTAAVVRPPTGSIPGDRPLDGLPPDWRTVWTQQIVPHGLGMPSVSAAEPVVATCPSRQALLLRANLAEDGSLLVDGAAEAVQIRGSGHFTADCGVAGAGRTLTMIHSLGPNVPVTMRTSLVADSVAVAPAGDQIALVKAGFPVEVLLTAPAESLPKPWDVTTTSEGGVVTALGERELIAITNQLRIVDASGVRTRVAIPEFADVIAARPDGTGGALAEVRTKRVLLVDAESATPVDCPSVTYVPGEDFATSILAAEAQIPAKPGYVDCRDGKQLALDPQLRILAYDIGASRGRIVARSGDRVSATTWRRGDAGSLSTVELPEVGAQDEVSFSPAADVALVYAPGAHHVTVHRRDGGTWNRTLNLATGLPGIVSAQFVDEGSFVLAIAARGEFELFDVATGRLVASDTSTSLEGIVGFSARRAGDDLFVGLRKQEELAAVARIKIPIGVGALTRQLCGLYPAGDC